MSKHDLITAQTATALPALTGSFKTKIQRVLPLGRRAVTLTPAKSGIRIPHKLDFNTRLWVRAMMPLTNEDREFAASTGLLLSKSLRARIAVSGRLARNIPCGREPLLVTVKPNLIVSTRGVWLDGRAEHLFPA